MGHWLLLPAGLLAQVVLPHKGMWVQERTLFLRYILADENGYFEKVFDKTAQIRKYSNKTVPPGVTITQSTASFCIQLEKKRTLQADEYCFIRLSMSVIYIVIVT